MTLLPRHHLRVTCTGPGFGPRQNWRLGGGPVLNPGPQGADPEEGWRMDLRWMVRGLGAAFQRTDPSPVDRQHCIRLSPRSRTRQVAREIVRLNRGLRTRQGPQAATLLGSMFRTRQVAHVRSHSAAGVEPRDHLGWLWDSSADRLHNSGATNTRGSEACLNSECTCPKLVNMQDRQEVSGEGHRLAEHHPCVMYRDVRKWKQALDRIGLLNT